VVQFSAIVNRQSNIAETMEIVQLEPVSEWLKKILRSNLVMFVVLQVTDNVGCAEDVDGNIITDDTP
jgi:hypothetical protein